MTGDALFYTTRSAKRLKTKEVGAVLPLKYTLICARKSNTVNYHWDITLAVTILITKTDDKNKMK